MPSSTQVYQDEAGIECTPAGLAKSIAGCFMFLVSLLAVAALCVIAAGTFWIAQSLNEFGVTVKDADENMYKLLMYYPLATGEQMKLAAAGFPGELSLHK